METKLRDFFIFNINTEVSRKKIYIKSCMKVYQVILFSWAVVILEAVRGIQDFRLLINTFSWLATFSPYAIEKAYFAQKHAEWTQNRKQA